MAFKIAKLPLTPPRPKRTERGSSSEKAYFGFIGQLPCCVSGQHGVQVAHLSTAAPEYGHMGRGKGTKAHYRWTLPLSPALHDEQHRGNEMQFWTRKGIDPHLLALKLFGLWTEYGDEAVGPATRLVTHGSAIF